jgi:hypothetical protein
LANEERTTGTETTRTALAAARAARATFVLVFTFCDNMSLIVQPGMLKVVWHHPPTSVQLIALPITYTRTPVPFRMYELFPRVANESSDDSHDQVSGYACPRQSSSGLLWFTVDAGTSLMYTRPVGGPDRVENTTNGGNPMLATDHEDARHR